MSKVEINSERDAADEALQSSAPSFAVVAQPSYLHTLFLDTDGLRPGWGFAFYVVTFLALQKLAVQLASAWDLGYSGLWSSMLEEVGVLMAATIPAIVLGRVERRPWRMFGLPGRYAFGKLFWVGAVWGFAGISLLMFALRGVHNFDFGHVVLQGVRAARFAAFWALMFLLVGLYEEFLLRGYSQFTLARGIGFWPAAVVLSCTFGLVHLGNGGEQWMGLLSAGLIGFFFCLTLRRTGNLWFAVGFHAAWDWGQSFFYSVPDSGTLAPGHLMSSTLHGPQWLSGGSVGPEGSVLCFAVMAVVWITFDRVYPGPSEAGEQATVSLPATAGSPAGIKNF